MKTLALAISLALAALVTAQELIPTATPETKTPAQIVAESLVEGMNNALKSRIDSRRVLWETTWENPRATPQQIVSALGNKAAIVFASAGLEAAMLEQVAAARGVSVAQLIGEANMKTLTVPPGWAATLNQDGTVALSYTKP